MVHKKFIKRGGKTFGPYYYENYREGGKVKTRYLGTTDPKKKVWVNYYLLIIPFVLIIGIGIFLMNYIIKWLKWAMRHNHLCLYFILRGHFISITILFLLIMRADYPINL